VPSAEGRDEARPSNLVAAESSLSRSGYCRCNAHASTAAGGLRDYPRVGFAQRRCITDVLTDPPTVFFARCRAELVAVASLGFDGLSGPYRPQQVPDVLFVPGGALAFGA